jgi:hypothetical protein
MMRSRITLVGNMEALSLTSMVEVEALKAIGTMKIP